MWPMVGALVGARASWLLSLFTYRAGRQPFHRFSGRTDVPVGKSSSSAASASSAS